MAAAAAEYSAVEKTADKLLGNERESVNNEQFRALLEQATTSTYDHEWGASVVRSHDETGKFLSIHGPGWTRLTVNILALKKGYEWAVVKVVRQGLWRQAQYPKAYIKRAAWREAQKMMLPIEADGVFSTALVDKYENSTAASESECVWTNDEGLEIPSFDGKLLPKHLLAPEDDEPDASLKPDADKILELANLDDGEREIIRLKLADMTEAEILDSAPSTDDRLRRQAALKRLRRRRSERKNILLERPKQAPKSAKPAVDIGGGLRAPLRASIKRQDS